jgi:pyruvate formate-lyase activating enzyme-like uncharacterized protein
MSSVQVDDWSIDKNFNVPELRWQSLKTEKWFCAEGVKSIVKKKGGCQHSFWYCLKQQSFTSAALVIVDEGK